MVILCSHRQEFQHFSPPQGAPGIPTSYSAYYNISVAKAELLNKLKDQPEMAEIGLGEEEVDHELAQKKVNIFICLRNFQHVASVCIEGNLSSMLSRTSWFIPVFSVWKSNSLPGFLTNEISVFLLFSSGQ